MRSVLKSRPLWQALLSSLALSQVGCGPELDPISRIETLRIVGVRKSAPYARPGESVDLQLLWEDGRQGPLPEVETFFGFWCVNPPGDAFGACLQQAPEKGREAQYAHNTNTFTIDIPEDALQPNPQDAGLPASGMAVVFYGVCAGKLDGALVEDGGLNEDVLENARDGGELIPRCLDEDGRELGPDDFVLGYSSILIYEGLRNENPEIVGFEADDDEVEIDCIDEACADAFPVPDLEGCVEGLPCLKTCEDDGDPLLCPKYPISVLLSESSAEADGYAQAAYGTDLEEAIWVSYFVDRGSVSPPVRLVNDATEGWQSDFGASIYAPSSPGPLRIWAAVRDNRGGLSWTRVAGYVED